MREMLFKAKRIDNGEWIEGYYYQTWSCWEVTQQVKSNGN